MRMRVSVIGALAMALVLLFATPGWASVSKSGTQPCPNKTGVARSYSTGTTDIYPPATGSQRYWNGGTG